MTTGRPVRVALLGCGAIAQAHLRAIAANPGLIEVAGLYDADRGYYGFGARDSGAASEEP